jgi:hypothetical protein
MEALRAARSLALLFLAAVAASDVAAQTDELRSPLPSHLPLGVEACFGRVYDRDHLTKHPRQRVTSFHVFRDFTPDMTREAQPETAEEMRKNDGTDGRVTVDAYVRFRDRAGLFWNSLSCAKEDGGKVRCSIDCDGGSFFLRPASQGLQLENQGFVVVGGCGASEDETLQQDVVKPGADDKVFRLDRLPLAVCTQLREAQKPAWAKLGAPIRARIATDNPVCFVRDYDADHLAKHPQQAVRRIAVTKPRRAAGDDRDPVSPELIFRVQLKNGQRFEGKSFCAPESYAYACPAKESDLEFHLLRAGDDHITVRDRRSALPALFKTRLGADDKSFRLRAAPAEACAF